jgi:hypothetical protein
MPIILGALRIVMATWRVSCPPNVLCENLADVSVENRQVMCGILALFGLQVTGSATMNWAHENKNGDSRICFFG